MENQRAIFTSAAETVPPQSWFGVSAIFHYLGPSFAVLLFPSVGVLGVAWLRIASAAALFAPWTRPWRTIAAADWRTRVLLLALGGCLAVMNTAFYLALDRLPISLVAAIEFTAPQAASWGSAKLREQVIEDTASRGERFDKRKGVESALARHTGFPAKDVRDAVGTIMPACSAAQAWKRLRSPTTLRELGLGADTIADWRAIESLFIA